MFALIGQVSLVVVGAVVGAVVSFLVLRRNPKAAAAAEKATVQAGQEITKLSGGKL